jgi:hypothetical protein
VRVTCFTHLIVLDLITIVMSAEAYKLWSFSLCSILQPSRISSLLGPSVKQGLLFPQPVIFPRVLSVCAPEVCDRPIQPARYYIIDPQLWLKLYTNSWIYFIQPYPVEGNAH